MSDFSSSPETERLAEIIGYYLASVVSGNNQPDMSGDPRKRIPSIRRRHFDDSCRACAEAIIATFGHAQCPQHSAVEECAKIAEQNYALMFTKQEHRDVARKVAVQISKGIRALSVSSTDSVAQLNTDRASAPDEGRRDAGSNPAAVATSQSSPDWNSK